MCLRTTKSLDESGYAARAKGKINLRAPKELLDDGVKSYDLKRNEHRLFFVLAPDVKLTVLRPYHQQIVAGGGWSPFLYYRYLAKIGGCRAPCASGRLPSRDRIVSNPNTGFQLFAAIL